MPEHGGRLLAAARQWGIPPGDWLDLSTGIAPWSYPVKVDEAAWRRLPEDDDGLVAAAAAYYGHPAPLPLPGSQAAIQWLPALLPRGRTVLPASTYGEYAPAWRQAGHEVIERSYDECLGGGDSASVIVLCHPNNPDGQRANPDQLLTLARQQAARGGWLVVDGAFADVVGDAGLTAAAGTTLPRLVVLRSLGKFFGLAGARVGFCCADATLQARLAATLGPWPLAHPSRVAALQALNDHAWQAVQRQRLIEGAGQLADLLDAAGLPGHDGGQLFRYVPCAQADALHDFLARRGILIRRFARPPALRFGLPGNAAEHQRLKSALADWNTTR